MLLLLSKQELWRPKHLVGRICPSPSPSPRPPCGIELSKSNPQQIEMTPEVLTDHFSTHLTLPLPTYCPNYLVKCLYFKNLLPAWQRKMVVLIFGFLMYFIFLPILLHLYILFSFGSTDIILQTDGCSTMTTWEICFSCKNRPLFAMKLYLSRSHFGEWLTR